jgi:hypothetical protein
MKGCSIIDITLRSVNAYLIRFYDLILFLESTFIA